jgi:glycosyltransferase involved in cell wall biosynthesis
MSPLFSIITVVYNGGATLEEAIVSVTSQRFRDWEYVIVDGGSKDNTLEIIKTHSAQVGTWISEPDKGIYDAMNKAVRLAKGRWLLFLGADDVLYDADVLSKMAEYTKQDELILYGDVIMKSTGRRYDGTFGPFKLATRNIPHQALFYPASVFKAFTYDTRYRLFADYALNLALFNDRRWQFRYVPVIVSCFNDGGATGSRQLDPAFEEDQAGIIKRHFNPVYYWYRVGRSFMKRMIARK